MEYLNQFHKESTERCLKQIEEWDKSPKPSEEAAKQAFEMHKRIKEQYPDKMPEHKLTLRYNLGTPEEMIILTTVDEQRYQQILDLVREEKLTATQAYDRTRPEKD